MNEADTCRKYVLPKLIAAGWDNEPYSFTEQKTFTDGRIILEQKGCIDEHGNIIIEKIAGNKDLL